MYFSLLLHSSPQKDFYYCGAIFLNYIHSNTLVMNIFIRFQSLHMSISFVLSVSLKLRLIGFFKGNLVKKWFLCNHLI